MEFISRTKIDVVELELNIKKDNINEIYQNYQDMNYKAEYETIKYPILKVIFKKKEETKIKE